MPLAASIELLHTATLVHDDVIDESDARRGRPTANARHHNAAAVMLGDYMFAHAAELICRTESLDIVKLFSRTLMAMASGELAQDLSAYQYSQDTMDYFGRISGKTASLFATSAEGGALAAGAPESWVRALRNYGDNAGMAFQIVDDVLDFEGSEAELGKPAGHRPGDESAINICAELSGLTVPQPIAISMLPMTWGGSPPDASNIGFELACRTT